jgi:hypothetical protein
MQPALEIRSEALGIDAAETADLLTKMYFLTKMLCVADHRPCFFKSHVAPQ